MTMNELEGIGLEYGAALMECLCEMESIGEIEASTASMIQSKVMAWEKQLMEIAELARRNQVEIPLEPL